MKKMFCTCKVQASDRAVRLLLSQRKKFYAETALFRQLCHKITKYKIFYIEPRL